MVCKGSVCGIDTETELIQNNYTTPPLVLFGACSGNQVQLCEWQNFDRYQPAFLSKNPNVKFGFFNGPFDQKVMGKDVWIPELNRENRVMELQAAYPAYRISTKGWFRPGFTLEMLTQEFLGVHLDKDEAVRLNFKRGQEITDEQYHYMACDAIATCKLAELLQGQPTESIQARAAFVLSEISQNGMLVDQDYVRQQQAEWQKVLDEEGQRLKSFGYPVKTYYTGFKGLDFIKTICQNIGIEPIDVETIIGEKVNFPPWFWRGLALLTYGHVLNKSPISEIRAAVRDLLVMVVEPPRAKELKPWLQQVDEALHHLMEDLECLECLDGVGATKPKGSDAWKILALLASERIASGDPQHNYLRDEVHEELKKEFKELHELNRGWLKDVKPVSQQKFLQNHVKALKAKYPDLELRLTDAAQKNINKVKVAEARAAKKEKREQRDIDVSDLVVYQVTGKEAWRFYDQGIEDPFLESYWKFKHAEKMLSTYVTLKYVEADGRVHPRFTGFLKTGRTGCSKPSGLIKRIEGAGKATSPVHTASNCWKPKSKDMVISSQARKGRFNDYLRFNLLGVHAKRRGSGAGLVKSLRYSLLCRETCSWINYPEHLVA